MNKVKERIFNLFAQKERVSVIFEVAECKDRPKFVEKVRNIDQRVRRNVIWIVILVEHHCLSYYIFGDSKQNF